MQQCKYAEGVVCITRVTSHTIVTPQVFAAVLSRSPSSDGVNVLSDTMTRLMPTASTSSAVSDNPQLLNAYTAEGHLRLVEVLIVPLSAEVVISLWQTLDAVRTTRFLQCFAPYLPRILLTARAGVFPVHEPPSEHCQAAGQPAVGKSRAKAKQQRGGVAAQGYAVLDVRCCLLCKRGFFRRQSRVKQQQQ